VSARFNGFLAIDCPFARQGNRFSRYNRRSVIQHQTSSASSRIAIGIVFAALGAIGFSAKGIIGKLVYAADGAVDPITLVCLRMLFALPVFLVIPLLFREPGRTRLTARDWLGMAWMGTMGYYIATILDFEGLVYVSASLERLLLYLYPTMVIAISVFRERRPITRIELLSLILSYVGVAIAVGGEAMIAGEDLLLGTVLVLLASAVYATFLVISVPLVRRYGTLRFTAHAMTGATGMTVAHFLIVHDVSALSASTPTVYALIGAMAVFSTILPALFTNAGLHRLGASRAVLVAPIGPISTIVLGHLILGESFTFIQFIGATLVIAGVLVSSRTST
jgi:drug/metabolite transporter (DMT)-like permease